MRAWTPILLIFLVPTLLFLGAIPGPDVVSADDHLSVHHAFQEEAGGEVWNPHLSDPALQFSALRKRVVASLKRIQAPLWNRSIYGGAPLLADGQSMVASPVTWFRLIAPEDVAQDLGVWWILVWTGLGTAVLFQRLGGSPWGCLAAGTAAMTGPFPMVWLLHPHAATFCWLPWVLAGIELEAAWLVALMVAGLMGGGHPGTMLLCLTIAMIWGGVRDRFRTAFLGILVGLVLSAAWILPVVEQVLRSTTLEARGGNRLPLDAFRDLIWPHYWGHPADESWRGQGVWADGQLHPGWMVLVLGLCGMGHRVGRGLMLAWLVGLVVAAVGMPGPANVARLGGMSAWFVALPAAIVADRWVMGAGRGSRSIRGTMVFLCLVGSGWWARHLDQGTIPAELHDPEPAQWVGELKESMQNSWGTSRVLGLDWGLQPNTGSLVGLRDVRGYDLPISDATHQLMSALADKPQGPWYPVTTLPALSLLRFLGVGVVVSPEAIGPSDWPSGEQGSAMARLALDGLASARPHVFVYRINNPAPEVWWTGHTSRATSSTQQVLQEVSARVTSMQNPPVQGAKRHLYGLAAVQPLRPIWDGESRVTIDLLGAGEGLIVLTEAWSPGWRTRVDGESARVVKVGGVWQGVIVSDDSEQVEFVYRPWGWEWGVRCSLAGGFLWWWLYVIRGRRKES